jgi:hypothetical protein
MSPSEMSSEILGRETKSMSSLMTSIATLNSHKALMESLKPSQLFAETPQFHRQNAAPFPVAGAMRAPRPAPIFPASSRMFPMRRAETAGKAAGSGLRSLSKGLWSGGAGGREC